MRARALAPLVLFANLACDAFLVGGKCLDGYVEEAGACVEEAGAGGGGAGVAGGVGGSEPESSGGAGSSQGGAGAGQGGAGGDDGCGALTSCDGRCVDTQSSPLHCGACEIACPSAVCEDGVCIGGPAGHVVALGLDFQTAVPNGQIGRVLGNAVFLHSGDPVRVVALKPPTLSPIAPSLPALIDAEASARGRAHDYATLAASDIPTAVATGQVDVLVVHGGALGRASDVPDMAAALGESLDSFFDDGGVVIAIPTPKSLGLVQTFLSCSGLLPDPTLAEAGQGDLLVVDWTDALAVGLLSPLPMPGKPVTIVPGDPGAAVVVLANEQGEPIALHRAVVSGD